MPRTPQFPWILYVGTYPPRECGIATFTRDISQAIAGKLPRTKTKILAMNKGPVNIYNYSDEVIYQVNESDPRDYLNVAEQINRNSRVKLVNIQHEFGIFGGEWGAYLVPFLKALEKNVVITFHSVLPGPDPKLKSVVQGIDRNVSCMIVMTQKAVEILRADYGVQSNIKVIPHGIPTIPYKLSNTFKTRIGYRHKTILSSFGLISENKGYEYVIEALPEVVRKYPDIIYLIFGQTHPIVLKREGEKYRNTLEKQIEKLGLQPYVKFYNKYLTLQEIIKYLQATDIYISSALNPNQITSGTLVYAMGAGRSIISTPFLHAQDIITPERGFLVRFKEAKDYRKAIFALLGNERLREQMARNAYSYTRHMIWPNVALAYIRTFNQYAEVKGTYHKKLPVIKMQHLLRLTDDFGIIQFANYVTPDHTSGYTIDDVARALIVAVMHYNLFAEKRISRLIEIYLDFIEYVQDSEGRFHNIVDYDRTVNQKEWSEDAHGRTLWALGRLLSCSEIPLEAQAKAKILFDKGLKLVARFTFPRAKAFAILGLYHYNQAQPASGIKALIKKYADALVAAYQETATQDWQWFEKIVAYSNARLPQALLAAYIATQESQYLKIGYQALHFLKDITFPTRKRFAPVGQKGWYVLGGQKAQYDQQPVDATAMLEALLLYYQITKRKKFYRQALEVFDWFLGNNSLEQVVYDQTTGGCNDGLGEFSLNLNQGAESTISYLMARLAIESARASMDK